MLHSHYSIDYVMKLPVKNVIKLLVKSVERNRESRAWQLYTSAYAHMNEENYMPFEEFYNPQETEQRDANEILNEVKGLLNENKGNWHT